MNHHLLDGIPLPKVSKPEISGDYIVAEMQSDVKIRKATLFYTTDNKHNTKRKWLSETCDIFGDSIQTKIPKEDIKIYYVNVTDVNGYTISSDLVFTPSFSKNYSK